LTASLHILGKYFDAFGIKDLLQSLEPVGNEPFYHLQSPYFLFLLQNFSFQYILILRLVPGADKVAAKSISPTTTGN
jgi:hypothetical protein